MTTLGYLCAIVLPPALGIEPHWGAAGLTSSAGVAGWIEFALLRASLNRRIGRDRAAAAARGAVVAAAAGAGGGRAFLVRRMLPPFGPLVTGAIVLPLYGASIWGWRRWPACRCRACGGAEP